MAMAVRSGVDRAATESLDQGVGSGAIPVSPPGRRDRPAADHELGEVASPIEGVRLVRLQPIADDRGGLTELIDLESDFWSEPIVDAYRITIRPGRIKGWGMHKLQADRYFVSSPNLRVVLFDGRTASPTFGSLKQFHFGPGEEALLRIPPGVWHADQNYGDEDAAIINFPTRPYDPSNPDKFRIDPDSGEIPFDWELRNR
jgi:dTDP-4-dehydrorhamnose 3,5-epimerase